MYGEVVLSDPKGEKVTVPMIANAATLIRYKQLFHSDLLSGIINSEGNFDVDVVSKLAFIMSRQAAKVDMKAFQDSFQLKHIECYLQLHRLFFLSYFLCDLAHTLKCHTNLSIL